GRGGDRRAHPGQAAEVPLQLTHVRAGGPRPARPSRGPIVTQIALLTFNGLASGMAVFLVAAGLTLVFGILHILKFSHGGVFMIAAYVALSTQALFAAPISGAAFAISVVAAGFVAAIIGLVIDRLVFRRLSGVP